MRLRVRRLEREDLRARVAWFNHPDVYMYMTVEVPMSLAATERWFQNASVDANRRDFAFAVSSKEEEITVAMGGLVDIDRHHGRAELYMLVGPEHRGMGYGRAVLRWLCNFGFGSLGLHRIYLTTIDCNERAQRLYGLHGFREEGRLRKHLFHLGEFRDRLVFGLLRDEWELKTWAVLSRPLELEINVDEGA